MAATHCINLMSHLGYLRLDQGAKKGLHPHYPKLCWCRTRIPDIHNCVIKNVSSVQIIYLKIFHDCHDKMLIYLIAKISHLLLRVDMYFIYSVIII